MYFKPTDFFVSEWVVIVPSTVRAKWIGKKWQTSLHSWCPFSANVNFLSSFHSFLTLFSNIEREREKRSLTKRFHSWKVQMDQKKQNEMFVIKRDGSLKNLYWYFKQYTAKREQEGERKNDKTFGHLKWQKVKCEWDFWERCVCVWFEGRKTLRHLYTVPLPGSKEWKKVLLSIMSKWRKVSHQVRLQFFSKM